MSDWKVGPFGSSRKAGPFLLTVDIECENWQWRADVVGDEFGMTHRVTVTCGEPQPLTSEGHAQCRNEADAWVCDAAQSMMEGGGG